MGVLRTLPVTDFTDYFVQISFAVTVSPASSIVCRVCEVWFELPPYLHVAIWWMTVHSNGFTRSSEIWTMVKTIIGLLNYSTINLGHLSINNNGSDFFTFQKRKYFLLHTWRDCKFCHKLVSKLHSYTVINHSSSWIVSDWNKGGSLMRQSWRGL